VEGVCHAGYEIAVDDKDSIRYQGSGQFYRIAIGPLYHVTVVFSNYSMEIYINGVLDTFMANSGLMTTTTKTSRLAERYFDYQLSPPRYPR